VPGKTLTDRALELEKLTAFLEERVENLREQIDRVPGMELRITLIDERVEVLRRDLGRIETGFRDTDSRIQDVEKKALGLGPVDAASLRERIREIEVKLDHLEKQRSEEHSKTWAIKLAVISALIGIGFTILTQFLSRYLPVK
jgi:chaperonin cofactor prefoldin